MQTLNYALDIILIMALFLTTLALQRLIKLKSRRVSKSYYNSLKAIKLRNRMKNVLTDDRAFLRKNYKMVIRRELIEEPTFIKLNF